MIDTMTDTDTAARRELLRTSTFLADGGLETTLIFLQGLDLPDFAAFPLVTTDEGRESLTSYYEPYLDIAERDGVPMILDTPTWRASQDWGARLGFDVESLARANRDAVGFVRELAAGRRVPVLLNGTIGPRGDGYVVGDAMTADVAEHYHLLQTRAFADAGADLVTAVTMTHVGEAIGVVRAARSVDLPVAIGFTVETDGRLPSGQPLGSAIDEVDAATDGYAEWFMINCAHPSHFADVLGEEAGGWRRRIHAVRANASRMSHEELDEAEELDRGDVAELADDYVALRSLLPALRVVGGCCGTDHEHIAHISAALHRPQS